MVVSKIIVSTAIIIRHISALESRIQSLRRIMNGIRDLINRLSRITWISPAARVLQQRAERLFEQNEESCRIAEEYRQNLEEQLQRLRGAEQEVINRMSNMRTDVFGV